MAKNLRPRPTRYAMDVLRLVRENAQAGQDPMEGVIPRIEAKYKIRYASVFAWLQTTKVLDDLRLGKTQSLEQLLQHRGAPLLKAEIDELLVRRKPERQKAGTANKLTAAKPEGDRSDFDALRAHVAQQYGVRANQVEVRIVL